LGSTSTENNGPGIGIASIGIDSIGIDSIGIAHLALQLSRWRARQALGQRAATNAPPGCQPAGAGVPHTGAPYT